MSRLLLQQTMSPRLVNGHKILDPFPVPPAKSEKHQNGAISKELPNNITHLHQNTRNAHCHQQVTMQLDVKATDAPQLRQLAASICGDNLASIRIQPISRTKSVHFWLSLKYDACLVDIVMTAIMRHLPSAQFGHFDVA
jgi:hypothetical protein